MFILIVIIIGCYDFKIFELLFINFKYQNITL